MTFSRHAPPNTSAWAVASREATVLPRPALLTSALALAAALALWAGDALAQEAQAQGTDQTQQTIDGQTGGQPAQRTGSDALLATVGDAEIRSSDLLQAIGALPPPLNQQPPDMVAAAAFQQLLMREAILQEARAQGLAQDPEVQSLVADATGAAEDAALVQVWLQRELEGRVGSEAVDQAYAGLQAVAGADLPPLEQIRPQIEASLRQQAMDEIQGSLLTGADITFYGPDGQPRAAGTGPGDAQASGGAQTGDATADPAQQPEDGTGSQGASDNQPPEGQDTPMTNDGQAEGGTAGSDQPPMDGTTDQSSPDDQPSEGGN